MLAHFWVVGINQDDQYLSRHTASISERSFSHLICFLCPASTPLAGAQLHCRRTFLAHLQRKIMQLLCDNPLSRWFWPIKAYQLSDCSIMVSFSFAECIPNKTPYQPKKPMRWRKILIPIRCVNALLGPRAFCHILRLTQQQLSQVIDISDRLSKPAFNKGLNLLALGILCRNH